MDFLSKEQRNALKKEIDDIQVFDAENVRKYI